MGAKGEELNKGDRIKVLLPSWFIKDKNIETRELIGDVEVVTNKAVKITGNANIRSSEKCLRCGRTITNPVSIKYGIGPECSKKIGLSRDIETGEYEDIKKELIENTKVEMFFPKSIAQIEIIENGDYVEEIKVETGDKYIYVDTPYRLKEICKSIDGGRWDSNKKKWKYPKSPFTAKKVSQAFHDYDITTDEEFDSLLDKADKIQEIQSIKNAENLESPPSQNDSWLHQRQAYHFAYPLHSCMLAMDMGTGKSKVVVDLVSNRNHKKVLIVSPLSVIDVWEREFKKHSIKDVRLVKLNRRGVKGKKQEAEKQMNNAERLGQPFVGVINYESVWRKPFGEWAKKAGFDLIVLDESHRIKSPGAKCSMYLSTLGKRIPYKIALTGTPMPHSPLDIYAQYRFLDPGIYGTSFNRFKNRYAIMGGYGGYEVLGYQNEQELHNKMYSIAYRVTKDILDLPEQVHVYRKTELESKAQKIYNRMENTFITEVEGGEVTALNALTKLLRLQQITSGHIGDDEGNVREVSTAKSDLLQDTLNDLDQKEPVVVFCRFTHDIEQVRKAGNKQGRTVAELSGRYNQLEAWQDGEYDLLAVQIRSGGVGIDLTRARYTIYYSLGFSLGDYEQSLARIHRPGQEQTTTFIHLLCENTVDEKVYNALKSRKKVVDYILEDLKR